MAAISLASAPKSCARSSPASPLTSSPAFIKWHGFRLVRERLRATHSPWWPAPRYHDNLHGCHRQEGTRRAGRHRGGGAGLLRNTDDKAAREGLAVSSPRLSTAYVGSSNLSKTAMTDGLEWNVRLSSSEQPHLLDTFRATFEDYWNDPSFEWYAKEDGDRFEQAVRLERHGERDLPLDLLTAIDVNPYPYQREVLEELAAERSVHNRWHSLVVMATGTGKTIVSALDYRDLRREHQVDTLLFVAHREELLRQALTTFRTVLRQGDFGRAVRRGGTTSRVGDMCSLQSSRCPTSTCGKSCRRTFRW